MRVVILVWFLLIETLVGIHDIGFVDGVAAPAEEGQVRTLDDAWPPPPPPCDPC